MIPISENDFLVYEKGNYKLVFKPPIDEVETEIFFVKDDFFDSLQQVDESREKFEEVRREVRNFFQKIIISIFKRENKEYVEYDDENIVHKIPFNTLLKSVLWYFEQYNLSEEELKN